MQVYGPSVSDQSSESSGTALFTRYLSCKLHANCTQIACPGMIVTLLPILPCADSYPVQIPTLCRYLTLCRCPCSCISSHACKSCNNLTLLPSASWATVKNSLANTLNRTELSTVQDNAFLFHLSTSTQQCATWVCAAARWVPGLALWIPGPALCSPGLALWIPRPAPIND